MLRKKSIKGNSADGPIIKHPRFGRIQWNQSYSYMPKAAAEPDTMDMQEIATKQEIAAEPEIVKEYEEEAKQETEAEDQPDEEEYEETITLNAADIYALHDTLEDI
jgi:hypothetical protein